MLMNHQEVTQIQKLVHGRSGLVLEESQRRRLEDHVFLRMELLGMERFTDFFRFLALGPSTDEFRLLVNAITINETFFFRDYTQLSTFGEEVLSEILERKDTEGTRHLRLLSAGCATGEEPYTLAIILRDMIEDFEAWDVSIYAIDINTDVLDAARHGMYGPRAVRDVPLSYRMGQFETVDENLRITQEIRDLVHFEYGNMYDVAHMARYRPLDFVFCRNVFIYFDDPARRRVLSTFYDLLLPGGYIFLGHAESVSRFSSAFEMRRFGDAICHRKQLATSAPVGKKVRGHEQESPRC